MTTSEGRAAAASLGLDRPASFMQPWILFMLGAFAGSISNGSRAVDAFMVVAAFIVGWVLGWLGDRSKSAAIPIALLVLAFGLGFLIEMING